MKNKVALLCAFVVLTLAGCQKDDSGMLSLSIEGMNDGSKMVVDGNVSYWANGDEVNINGTTATVNVSTSGNTTTTAVSVASADAFYGVYPASICGNNNGALYTLNLPSSYTYATTTLFGRTYQNLHTPMVGYTESSNMQFKHVTAALNVKVVNSFGIDVRVTDITISSNKYQLSGTTSVSIGNEISVAPVTAESNAALRQVQMTFGETHLDIPSGGSAVVQVPVLPVDNDNRFTISVTIQNKDDAEMSWTFSKTQAGASSDGYALDRAQVGYAPAKFGGVFTVASGKQVRFAPGNLQYQASSGTWRFAKHQYDAIGNAEGNSNFSASRSSQEAWIDLFGWGTSGQSHGNTYYMPYEYNAIAPNYGYGYGPKVDNSYLNDLTIANKGEWGLNAICNGGNEVAIWRTLSNGQIDTLFTKRMGATIGSASNCRYAKAKVNGVKGLLIFSDNYAHPAGVNRPNYINMTGSGGWDYNDYTLDEWNKMEVAGAVFLPVTSKVTVGSIIESNIGYYWSSTQYKDGTKYYAVCFYFGVSQFYTSYNHARNFGCAVRLVRDVE